jgi:hypothetical protein
MISSRLMKAKAFSAAIAALVFVFFRSQALAVPVTFPSLGAAGGFTVLDIGSNGTVSASASSITGNVGVNGGNFSDSGTPITGNLVTSSTGNVSLSGATVSGTTSKNPASLSSAASAANTASSAALGGSSGGGVGVGSIIYNNAGTIDLNAGVYNLTSLVLNGTTLDLTAGADYIFNISGPLTLNSSEILDLTGADVLFNITGTQGVALSGGSVLDGIVLAPDANFSESGRSSAVGEIISGATISISGAKVQGIDPPSVPDSGSSMFLLIIGLGCLCLFQARKKFLCLIPFHSPDVSSSRNRF